MEEGKPYIAVVIPTYNERDNIVRLITELSRVMGEAGIEHFYMIVDDNSPDGTAEAAKRVGEEKGIDVRVVVREKKAGLGSAIREGFVRALRDERVTHVLTMDADLSHRPEDFRNFIPYIWRADLIQGSRYMEGGGVVNWGLHRKIISRVANFIVERLYHVGVREHTTNYRLYSRAAAEKVAECTRSSGYEWIIEALLVVHAFGFRIVEVPIVFVNREKGKSKLGVRHIIRWFSYIIGYRKRYKIIKSTGKCDGV